MLKWPGPASPCISDGSDCKESACNARHLGLIPDLEDPQEKGMATHSSILAMENSMDRGAWWATVHRVTKSQTQLKRFSMHAHTCLKLHFFNPGTPLGKSWDAEGVGPYTCASEKAFQTQRRVWRPGNCPEGEKWSRGQGWEQARSSPQSCESRRIWRSREESPSWHLGCHPCVARAGVSGAEMLGCSVPLATRALPVLVPSCLEERWDFRLQLLSSELGPGGRF